MTQALKNITAQIQAIKNSNIQYAKLYKTPVSVIDNGVSSNIEGYRLAVMTNESGKTFDCKLFTMDIDKNGNLCEHEATSQKYWDICGKKERVGYYPTYYTSVDSFMKALKRSVKKAK